MAGILALPVFLLGLSFTVPQVCGQFSAVNPPIASPVSYMPPANPGTSAAPAPSSGSGTFDDDAGFNGGVSGNGFTIEVFDENGMDITAQSDVVLPSAPSRLRKRNNNPILCNHVDEDGNEHKTYTSYCLRDVNNQAYLCDSISLGPGQLHDFFGGSCHPDEICVDGIITQNSQVVQGQPIAYCSTISGLATIVLRLYQNGASQKHVVVKYGGSEGPQDAMEAIMQYNSDDDASANQHKVSNITISDQSASVTPPSMDPYTTLTQKTCTGCASLGIQPIPAGTARWVIDTLLPAGSGTMNMYISFL